MGTLCGPVGRLAAGQLRRAVFLEGESLGLWRRFLEAVSTFDRRTTCTSSFDFAVQPFISDRSRAVELLNILCFKFPSDTPAAPRVFFYTLSGIKFEFKVFSIASFSFVNTPPTSPRRPRKDVVRHPFLRNEQPRGDGQPLGDEQPPPLFSITTHGTSDTFPPAISHDPLPPATASSPSSSAGAVASSSSSSRSFSSTYTGPPSSAGPVDPQVPSSDDEYSHAFGAWLNTIPISSPPANLILDPPPFVPDLLLPPTPLPSAAPPPSPAIVVYSFIAFGHSSPFPSRYSPNHLLFAFHLISRWSLFYLVAVQVGVVLVKSQVVLVSIGLRFISFSGVVVSGPQVVLIGGFVRQVSSSGAGTIHLARIWPLVDLLCVRFVVGAGAVFTSGLSFVALCLILVTVAFLKFSSLCVTDLSLLSFLGCSILFIDIGAVFRFWRREYIVVGAFFLP
ncbi:hypothetical protein JCM6882_000538 [Rhodosporidiobolus microsporus]